MSWLVIIILAYFLFAIVSLGDKALLSGDPNPKSYTFYVGLLGAAALLLIPFVGFFIPSLNQLLLALFSGVIFIFAIFFLFSGLEEFEASRVIPAIGGMTPVFTFAFSFIFSKGQEILDVFGIAAFIFLVLGSIFITYEKGKKISLKSFSIASLAAMFFALHFVLSKYVYIEQPFWNGFIWMRVGSLIVILFLFFSKEVRSEIFQKKFTFTKKTGTFFFVNQIFGALAFILQHFAISLAGISYLPIITALQGTQYVFLFVFAFILSFKFPMFIREKTSKEIILQKISAIIFVITGLVFLIP